MSGRYRDQEGDLVGGYANVLFAGGHVAQVCDTGGQLGYYGDPDSPEDDVPDGFLGPYKTAGGPEINDSAFREIRGTIWWTPASQGEGRTWKYRVDAFGTGSVRLGWPGYGGRRGPRPATGLFVRLPPGSP